MGVSATTLTRDHDVNELVHDKCIGGADESTVSSSSLTFGGYGIYQQQSRKCLFQTTGTDLLISTSITGMEISNVGVHVFLIVYRFFLLFILWWIDLDIHSPLFLSIRRTPFTHTLGRGLRHPTDMCHFRPFPKVLFPGRTHFRTSEMSRTL